MNIRRFPHLALLLILGMVVVLYFVGVSIKYFILQKEVTNFSVVKFGDNRNEVSYRLGPPNYVIGESLNHANLGIVSPVYSVADVTLEEPLKNALSMPPDTGLDSYPSWGYQGTVKPKASLDVSFDKTGKVIQLSWTGDTVDNKLLWGPIFGICNGDSEEKILSVGTPTASSVDGMTKTIEFSHIGVAFSLQRGTVYAVTLKKIDKPHWAILKHSARHFI